MTLCLKRLIEWLNNSTGQKLRCVLALIYVYDNQEDNNSPQAIFLEFDNNLGGCLKCASDGESIEYESALPSEVDLGGYGKEIFKDISKQGSWVECIGNNLDSGFVLLSDNNICIGIRLLFQSGKSIDIVNLGDEMYVYDILPEAVVEEENIVIKKITR